MTYRELLEKLRLLTEPQLNDTVTVVVDEEYKAISYLDVSIGDDVLDDNHIYLVADD